MAGSVLPNCETSGEIFGGYLEDEMFDVLDGGLGMAVRLRMIGAGLLVRDTMGIAELGELCAKLGTSISPNGEGEAVGVEPGFKAREYRRRAGAEEF